MDAEELIKDIKHQRSLYREYKARSQKNELQIAGFGELHVPEYKLVERDKIELQIHTCDEQLKQLKDKAIEIKINEMNAFQCMIKVLSNESAKMWVFTAIYTIFLEGIEESYMDKHEPDMLTKEIWSMCNERIIQLTKDISNIQNM